MPWYPSTSDQIRASAIWPTAAAPWLSSSFRGPRGNFRRLRPSAIEPDETTRTSRPSPCSLAISAASAASHAERTSPAWESIRSEEPTLTTMRRKFLSAGRFMMRSNERDCREAIRASFPIWKWRGRGKAKFASALRRRRRRPRVLAALGLERHRRLADHLDQRLERFGHAFAGRGREQQRRLLRGALQPIALLLQF